MTDPTGPITDEEADYFQKIKDEDLPTAKILNQEDAAAFNPPMTRTAFTLTVNTYEVNNLRESVDLMSLMLGRHGLDAFFVVATDPDSGDQWVVASDNIIPMAEWEARAAEIDADSDDPALEDAVNHVVSVQLNEAAQGALDEDQPDH